MVRELQQVQGRNTIHENQQIHRNLVQQTSIEQDRGPGKKHQTVTSVDFENPEHNDVLLVNQFGVEADLRNYLDGKERAEELGKQIQWTDDLIDEIVYGLHGLPDEEIEIVEDALGDDRPVIPPGTRTALPSRCRST